LNSRRIEALVEMGSHLANFSSTNKTYTLLQEQVRCAVESNGWFTQKSIEETFKCWGIALSKENITTWLSSFSFLEEKTTKKVALILAGNIPMVGFHDIISVWICGHQSLVKCASKDLFLLPYMTNFLENEASEKGVSYATGKLTGFDAVIATGSNNAARYFDHYFSKYPNIIRKNRNGIAVIEGNETKEELLSLGKDMLQFFGLGCRNVSKIYLPEGYDLNEIFGGVFPYAFLMEHAKYANNYDYNKAVFLMSTFDFLENGFFMLKEEKSFSAPIACTHYEYYKDLKKLTAELSNQKESIQCIISHLDIEGSILFGKSQNPELWDYADGVDTVSFLLTL
ncbi:MAG: hypothetical protein ACI9TK_001498, partial [Flavobacteriaceae bacterium]